MFGLLKPGCGTPPEERAQHRRAYCGLCQSLGAQFGLGWRGLHSHDAVLVGLVADGLARRPAAPSRTRCPLLPVVHRDTMAPESPAMRYAASVQMLLGDQWLADKAEEGSRLAAAGRRALPSERAWALVEELGLDLSWLRGFESRQAAAEREADLEAAAEPTRRALALVFGAIAELPGGTPEAAEALALLGEDVGLLVYTCDALEDLERDLDAGAFNPLLRRGGVDVAAVRRARRRVEEAGERLERSLHALPLLRHRELVRRILLGTLVPRARRAGAAAERLAASNPVPRTPTQRLAWALVAALTFAWTFLFAAVRGVGGAAAAAVRPRAEGEPEPKGCCDHVVFRCCDCCTESCGCCDDDACDGCCKCCEEECGSCSEAGL